MRETFKQGSIEVIAGCMFSGKSEELIRRLRRAQIARQWVQVFKPDVDNRGGSFRVLSHSRQEFPATPLARASEILERLQPKTQVLGLDEAQFFDHEIVQIAQRAAERGIRVIVAGLDLDYRGMPFGSMPELLAMAERVDKLTAICTECGEPATRTQRLTSSQEQVEIGAAEKYAARCRHCYAPPTL